MLRRILLASVGAMALTGVAFAADLPGRAPPPVYLPPPPVFTWTGLYVGGQIGYAWGRDSGTLDTLLTLFGPPVFSASSFNASPNGEIGGAHIGYNWQISQWVLGVEADVDSTNYQGHSPVPAGLLFGPGNTVRDAIRSTIQGSFHGRVGWAWNNWLFYGTGGVAFTDVTNEYGLFSMFDSRTQTRVGWTAGGGIEYAVTNNWIFGVEYRYTDFGHFTDNGLFGFTMPSTPLQFDAHHHLTENRVQARVSYKFDWFNPGPVVAKY